MLMTSIGGGLLIGAAALLLYVGIGRIAGISGIIFGLIDPLARGWRLSFLAGLVGGGLLAAQVAGFPPADAPSDGQGLAMLIAAGMLVGIGTRLGNGCTSGHGVCGLARLSTRSLAAVAVFMLTGMVIATVVRLSP